MKPKTRHVTIDDFRGHQDLVAIVNLGRNVAALDNTVQLISYKAKQNLV